jgi:FLVCR family MFS transporter 7
MGNKANLESKSSVASVPSFFIPASPPTPPSAAAAVQKTPLSKSFAQLYGNGAFYLIFIPFAIYVGFFNALSSLIAQVLQPYGYTDNQAGKRDIVVLMI